MILTDTDIRYLQKRRYIGFSDISVIRYAIPRQDTDKNSMPSNNPFVDRLNDS